MGKEDRTIESLRRDYPDKFEKIEGASLKFTSEHDLKSFGK